MRNFFKNLLGGLRLASFQKVRPTDFHISLGQIVSLVAFNLLLSIAVDYWRIGAPAEFNLWGVSSDSQSLLLLLLACVAAAWLYAMPYLVLELMVVTASALPILYLPVVVTDTVYNLSIKAPLAWAIYTYYALFIWQAVIFFRSLKLLTARHLPRLIPVFVIFYAIAVLPLFYLPRAAFWTASQDEAESPPRQRVDAEQVFYAHPALIKKFKEDLLKERPGISDLYFVGMGSYAFQDVFMKEVRYVQRQFDERFDTRG
ncbi:MAG: hypothetical protein ABIN45_00205, partial [Gammaproteobacteria bacterium]